MQVFRLVGLGGCWLGLLVLSAPVRADVTIRINNVDAAEVGFNDPTPVRPVGGNPGRTLGEQRLNVLQSAAELWGGLLEGDVDIVIQATFQPLPCSPTTAVLGGPVRSACLPTFRRQLSTRIRGIPRRWPTSWRVLICTPDELLRSY